MTQPETLPSALASGEDVLDAHYHDMYPGLKKSFFHFLNNVSRQKIDALTSLEIITEQLT
jgi:hypothetical protein